MCAPMASHLLASSHFLGGANSCDYFKNISISRESLVGIEPNFRRHAWNTFLFSRLNFNLHKLSFQSTRERERGGEKWIFIIPSGHLSSKPPSASRLRYKTARTEWWTKWWDSNGCCFWRIATTCDERG